MTRVEWLNSLYDESRAGRFALHERSYRAKRSLLIASTLLVVIPTFSIDIRSVSNSGIEISAPLENVQLLLKLLVVYLLFSFSLFALADFNERPVPAFRKKIAELWSKAFSRICDSYKSEFQMVTKKYWENVTPDGFRFTDIERVVFGNNPDWVIDESESKRANVFFAEAEAKFPNLIDPIDEELIRKILQAWRNKSLFAYLTARSRHSVFLLFNVAMVYGLEIIFPIFWSLVALFYPDLSTFLVIR